MSKTSIPNKVKLALVGRAGGRCEYPGCNKRLDLDELTSRRMNLSVFAHIVADSPDGPRGDAVRSTLLASEIDNLMLLCFDHHKMIDVDAIEDHPELTLFRFKQEHEERVANLLDIHAVHKTRLLFVKANIGGRTTVVSRESARAAVLPMYPERDDLLIDLSTLAVRDDEPSFWSRSAEEIVRQVNERLRPTLANQTPTSIAVFALAPIPLLMVLGRALGDIAAVHVFQKHRAPDSWAWENQRGDADDRFMLDAPDAGAEQGDVAFVLSVSGVVHENEVYASLPGQVPIWRISASRPQVDFVRTRDLLAEFSGLFRQALHDIRRVHGPDVRIHLFPAVPNSVAIECGKVLLPKADPAVRVYDRNRNKAGWVFALDLLGGAEAVETAPD
ncbi:SAVED domain-containing protein [Myxococcota bacterium]|nr:SAVED domain-containing protein [Myxococcota bacterium]